MNPGLGPIYCGGRKMEEKKKDEYVLAEIIDNEEGITAENTETEVSGSVNFREEVEASERE